MESVMGTAVSALERDGCAIVPPVFANTAPSALAPGAQ